MSSKSSSTSKTKASATISFKASCSTAGESIKIEGDEDLNIDSSGESKSSFAFGDKYYFRVYKTSGISGYKMSKSDGTTTTNGTGKSVTQKETLKFENTDTASTSYPIKSINSMSWWGKDLGTTKKSASMEITSEDSGVAVGELSYESSYDSYYITVSQPSGYDTEEDAGYEVLIYVEETTS